MAEERPCWRSGFKDRETGKDRGGRHTGITTKIDETRPGSLLHGDITTDEEADVAARGARRKERTQRSADRAGRVQPLLRATSCGIFRRSAGLKTLGEDTYYASSRPASSEMMVNQQDAETHPGESAAFAGPPASLAANMAP